MVAPFFSDITSYVLMMLVAIVAVLAFRVVFRFTSKKHREMYVTRIKYSLAIGLVLGFVLPWNGTLGLLSALFSGSFFLVLALYTMLVMGELGNIPLLAQSWMPRETIKRWFSYFSIIEGVMGITGFVLPIAASTLLSFEMAVTITPLAYSSVAILADLFDLTFPNPPYHELLSLIHIYYLKHDHGKGTGEYFIEDSQFPLVLEKTDFTAYELREALELLVRQCLAERETPLTPLGRVRFKIYQQGIQATRLEYEEKMLQLSTQKQSVAKALEYFETDDARRVLDTPRKRRNALSALSKLEHDSHDFFHANSYFLEDSWLSNTLDRIRKQREFLAAEKD